MCDVGLPLTGKVDGVRALDGQSSTIRITSPAYPVTSRASRDQVMKCRS